MSERWTLRAAGLRLVLAMGAVACVGPSAANEPPAALPPIITISADELAGKSAAPSAIGGNYIEATRAPKTVHVASGHQGDFFTAVVAIDGGGTYVIHDYPGDEFVFVQHGSVTLTAAGSDTRHTFEAGEFFLVPKGWKGTWDMPGDYREFVVLSRDWGPALAGRPVVSGIDKPVEVKRIDPITPSAKFEPVAMDNARTRTLRAGRVQAATLHWGDYAVMVFDSPDGARHRFSEYPGDEYVHVVNGTATLTDAGGKSITFQAGDNFIATRAFEGVWDVSPAFRELVVIDRKHLEAPGGPVTEAERNDPSELFARRCVSCHALGVLAPTLYQIGRLTAEEVEQSLWHGVMQEFAQSIDSGQRAQLARWIAGLNPDKATRGPGVPMCKESGAWMPAPATDWPGWARDNRFNRHVDDASVTAQRAAKTRLAWALPLPITTAFEGAGNPVAVVGDRVFAGNVNHWVYSIDARTGCAHWAFRAAARIRSNVAVADGVLVFGDVHANVYGLDAATGRLLWREQADVSPTARISGNVTLHRGVAYVGVSALQELSGMRPDVPCCSFRGSVLALDARTGAVKWKTYTIEEPLQTLGTTADGTPRYGPAGVPVWSGISVDDTRGAVYVGTGNQWSEPKVAEADAVLALDMGTGRKRWVASLAPAQMGGADIYHLGCETWVDPKRATCSPVNPKGQGDRDIAAPPAITRLADGRELVLAGSKDGMFYALDPDTGKTNWQVRVGAGGELGGIEYGFANDGRRAYVPVSDVNADGRANGSLTAIDLATGKIAWRVAGATDTCTGKAQPPCNNAYLGPPSVAGEVVYAGSNDGVLRAFDRADGTVLWSFDTVRDYAGANGVQGTGGSLGFGGPVIAGSRLYIMSGHSFLNTGLPGNVLLAFDIP